MNKFGGTGIPARAGACFRLRVRIYLPDCRTRLTNSRRIFIFSLIMPKLFYNPAIGRAVHAFPVNYGGQGPPYSYRCAIKLQFFVGADLRVRPLWAHTQVRPYDSVL